MTGFEKPFLDSFCNKLTLLGWEQINSQTDLLDSALLKDVFRRKIKQLNKAVLNDYNEGKIFNEILTKLSSANENKILEFLKYGMTILITERNTQIPLNLKLIDYENKDNNEYNLIREQSFTKGMETIRGDIVLFINGIPIIILEGKDPLKATYKKQYIEALDQIMRYQYQVKDLFKYVQLGIGVAESYPYIGTFPNYGLKDVGHYNLWKENRKEDIYYLLNPNMLTDFIKYFVFFAKNRKGEKFKLVARYNQYHATMKAIDRISKYSTAKSDKNQGLVWHWQGSGKTYTMFFTANFFLNLFHKINPLVFFVVDRTGLETQFDTVVNSIDNPKFGSAKVIDSIKDLEESIKNVKESGTEWGLRIVTVQKFSPEKLDIDLKIDKKEVLFLIDEAHRSQYGELAATMRKVFEKGMFFGYTGTPVFKNERNTFKEFSYLQEGETFLDVYFIAESQEDKFTLPFTHRTIEEGKSEDGIKILLNEEELKGLVESFEDNYDDSEELLETEDVAKDLKSKLRKNITKIKVVLSNEKRIEKLVKYISEKLKEDTEGYNFKAMVVAVNRASCVKYKKFFDKYFDNKALSEVVMSYQPTEKDKEVMDFKTKLNARFNKSDWSSINQDIVDNFLKKKSPQVLIVTDMLLAGFDAPDLKVMYLDKPIYYHRLLQAIARVNRPAKDKEKGIIVDSVGLLSHINKTVSLYNQIATEEENIKKDLMENLLKDSKNEVDDLKKSVAELNMLLKKECEIDVPAIIKAIKENKLDVDTLMQKISNISLSYDKKEVNDAIKALKSILRKYRALGAEPGKLVLLWDIKVLLIIYYTLMRHINKGKRSSRQMWDAIVNWIHESTIVTDLLPKVSVDLDPRVLTKVELTKKGEAGGYYHTIKNEAKEHQKNPLYKEIVLKLDRIRSEWVNRNLGLEEFLEELKKIDKEKEKLDKIGKKELTERVSSFVSAYFKQRFKHKVNTDSLKEMLVNFSGKTRILEKDRKEINLAVAKMVIKELPREKRKEMTTKELIEMEEIITNFIVSEIRK